MVLLMITVIPCHYCHSADGIDAKQPSSVSAPVTEAKSTAPVSPAPMSSSTPKKTADSISPAGVEADPKKDQIDFFQMGPDANIYVIQPGDKLNIQVYGEKELSNVFLVNTTGKINYPLVGEVQAAGLSLDGFKKFLVESLSRDYLTNPQVEVDFAESSSKSVSVLGQVPKPGNYALTPNMTLAKLIPQVGGFLPNADAQRVKISRSIREGQRQSIEVDSNAILNGTKPDIRLWPGDMLFVNVAQKQEPMLSGPGPEPQKDVHFVTILGQVKSPGNYSIDNEGTIITLLGRVGGFTPVAVSSRVRVVRKIGEGKTAKVFNVNVDAIMAGREQDFRLEPGDLIVVDESFF
jgi:polysaccharide export outer membrane protein